MPGGKRATKTASYKDQNDDDDFISAGEISKKTRSTKSNDQPTESNSSNRQTTRKRKEKLSKAEQEELDLALKLSNEIVQMKEVSIEIPIIDDVKENISNTSTVSSNKNKKTTSKETDEYEENSLPKTKRMKVEEEENIDEKQSENEEEEEVEDENEEEEEEEEETKPQKRVTRKIEVTKKNAEMPTVKSIEQNSSRSMTQDQQKPPVSTIDLSNKKPNAPVGFPTSKIIIPSVQASRVGLSRKASTIKPLHPNLNQRSVHE
ncbi:unnamed protein product [Rotaria magnacalcarata]|uniref:Uncharacterized protein n=1 Tax=Rotaria magnacalcarata TaxID=392030 RepID=A0A816SC88_9BILA|nr:unnamed protein product [Rotaria magnacalcarata]CAF1577074.1 unnamed protein product [Rotaria magnacalcarata]CAF2082079.1 unnamed protein product [Rotaria magnacalcarata]